MICITSYRKNGNKNNNNLRMIIVTMIIMTIRMIVKLLARPDGEVRNWDLEPGRRQWAGHFRKLVADLVNLCFWDSITTWFSQLHARFGSYGPHLELIKLKFSLNICCLMHSSSEET